MTRTQLYARSLLLFGAMLLSFMGFAQPTTLPDFSVQVTNARYEQPQSGFPRDPYTVSYRINRTIIGTNLNTRDLRVFNVKAYLSTDSILSADDLGNANQDVNQNNFSLNADAELLLAFNPKRTGTNYIIFKIDNENVIAESNENNNVSNAFPINVYFLTCPSNGLAPWNEWISNVKLNTINNTSEKTRYNNVFPVVTGYSNFLDVSTTLNKGQTYPLSITPSLGYPTYQTNLFSRIWIDYNQNGSFEDAEIVFAGNNLNQTVTENITVPTTALIGTTVLRVSMKAGAYPTACEVFEKGEVEDYTVNITGTTPIGRDTLHIVNVTGPDILPQSGSVTLNVTFRNTGTAPSVSSRRMAIYETSQYQGEPWAYQWFDVTKESNFVAIGQSIAPNATVTVPMTFQLSNTFTSKSPLATRAQIGKGKLIAFENMPLGQQNFIGVGTNTLYSNLLYNAIVDLPNGNLSIEIVAPDTTFGGDNVIRYSARVRNLGTQTVRNVQAALYYFGTSIGTVTEVIRPSRGVFERVLPYPGAAIQGNWTIGDMLAGETATCTVELTIARLSYDRIQTISVGALSNQLDEENILNNSASKNFIFSTTKPRAALSVANLRVNPSVASQTDSITVSVDIKNTGNLAANNFLAGVFLRLNANDSTGGYPLTNNNIQGFENISLAPNASISLTKRFGLNTSIPLGNYFLQVFADAGYQIGEVKKSDNRISVPFQVSNQTQNSCRSQDSLQLVRLYNATNGANWVNKWNLATPINTWRGITLNANGCVEGIQLNSNELTGTLPNLSFTNLLTFNCINNRLTGSIPNVNFPKLEGFYLSENQLSGSVPNLNSPNLKDVQLSLNQLTGSIPNFNYRNLTILTLQGNRLTGSIPNFNLPNLTYLELSGNQLTGAIPNFNLPSLRQLFLSSNQLSGSIPNVNLPKLEYLYLPINQLTGTIPNFNAPNLTKLILYSNKLTGSIPNFTNAPILTELDLSNNNLSGCLPFELKSICSRTDNIVNISSNPSLVNQNFATFCSNSTGQCTSTSSNVNIGLSLGTNKTTYKPFTNVTIQIGAINYNSQPFSNVKIEFKFPAKTVSGGTALPTYGIWQEWCVGGVQCYTWTIPTLPANVTGLLDVPLFVLDATGPIVFTAKLLASTPTDQVVVDNIQTFTINPANAAQASPTQALAFQVPTQLIPVIIQAISPNPTESDIVVKLDSWTKQDVDVSFSDITGKTIHAEKRTLDKGLNRVAFDVTALPQGVYFIQTNVGKGRNVPTKFVKM